MKVRALLMRCGALLIVAIVMFVTTEGWASDASAQGATSLTVHFRLCPDGFDHEELFEVCHDNPIADARINIWTNQQLETFGFTDEAGNIAFDLEPGAYSIIGTPDFLVWNPFIYCSDSNGNGAPYDRSVSLQADDQVVCDYYVGNACEVDSDCSPDLPPATITATVYNCPAGMTADALVGDDCTLATTGFSIAIFNLTGEDEFLTLDDATFDGSSYLWSSGPAATEAFEGANYGIRETVLPGGYTTFAVYGSNVVDAVGDIVHLRITRDAPDAQVMIYNFAPAGDDDDDGTPVTQLPSTGTGSSAIQSADPIWVLIAVATLLSGVVALRKRSI
jgi:hypothetical protein